MSAPEWDHLRTFGVETAKYGRAWVLVRQMTNGGCVPIHRPDGELVAVRHDPRCLLTEEQLSDWREAYGDREQGPPVLPMIGGTFIPFDDGPPAEEPLSRDDPE